MEKIGQASAETTADDRFWNMMPSISYTEFNALYGQFHIGNPEKKDMDKISGSLHVLQMFHICLSREGSFKPKIQAALGQGMNLLQHESPRMDGSSLRGEWRQTTCDEIGVYKFKAFYVFGKKLTGKGGLTSTIRTRNDVEIWSCVFILQMIPSFNDLSSFELLSFKLLILVFINSAFRILKSAFGMANFFYG